MPKKTFECAEIQGAILITEAKGNQGGLEKQITHGCHVYQSIDSHCDPIDKNHGRIEQRTYEVFSAVPMLDKWHKEWPFIRQVIRVIRCRDDYRRGKSSQTVHYYVTNSQLTAKEYGTYIRQHWFIENKLHHVKDVAFQEDKMKKQVNPYIYSTCIDIALNVMRGKNAQNIKSTLYKNSLKFSKLYENIKNIL